MIKRTLQKYSYRNTLHEFDLYISMLLKLVLSIIPTIIIIIFFLRKHKKDCPKGIFPCA